MLDISKVIIKGFQSHVDSGFTLSPGLTVITGPSDAGKTAVIRALRWLAFNEPQGEAFLHTIRNADGSIKSAVDEAVVTVEFSDGTVITKTRRKGKTTYTHSLYLEPWEKAEVPPEIKETLGLVKQTYGENFETCLNFAFQLDPPFLLSETGSAGAKVLGKLAGTEVVDKSIGAVNKLTHRIRTDIAQAEKTIGQLDVELLEYLTVDQDYETLLQLENIYHTVEEKLNKQKVLLDLQNSYTGLTERKQVFLDTVDRLQSVPGLLQELGDVERTNDTLQMLSDLDMSFWSHIKVCEVAKKTLRTVKNVDELKKQLNVVADLEGKTITLQDLRVRYLANVKFASLAEDEIRKADTVLQNKQAVNLLSDKLDRLNGLQTLSNKHRLATEGAEALQGRITTLEVTTVLQGKISGLRASVERIEKLQELADTLFVRSANLKAEEVKLTFASNSLEAATKELADAWEAAGGVCPLCEQPTERTGSQCTH